MLNEKKVLITRDQLQAKTFSDLVLKNNGIPIEVPLLEIKCKSNLNQYLHQLRLKHQWIFFTSANGVHCFYNEGGKSFLKENRIYINIAAVGSKTNYALRTLGYEADFIPSTFNARTMVTEFLAKSSNKGPVLLIRGNRSLKTLPKILTENGIQTESLEVYETIYNKKVEGLLNDHLANTDIDYYTFMSPSTVEAFDELTNKEVKNIKCVCIGTTTANRAKELGFSNIMVANPFTMEGMMQSMIADEQKEDRS